MAAQSVKAAFILGYTGETGKALVKELSRAQYFSRVVLIGRRKVDLPEDVNKDFEQKVVDYDKINEYEEAFRGCQIGFCCLGTTRGKAGAKGFVKVDRDYVLQAAEVAKTAGCQHFHLVSSTGADKTSLLLYPKTKGEAEEGLKDMKFDRLSIYRPGLLLCDRTESRPMERVAMICFTPFAKLFPTVGSVSTEKLAQAMINVSLKDKKSDTSFEMYDNGAIHKEAKS